MNKIHRAQALLIISKSCAREYRSWRPGDAARNTPEGPEMGAMPHYVIITKRGWRCHRDGFVKQNPMNGPVKPLPLNS
jgi:hypothetical protein